MTSARALPDLDWRTLASPIARAEDALARLDERLAKSPIRVGGGVNPRLFGADRVTPS